MSFRTWLVALLAVAPALALAVAEPARTRLAVLDAQVAGEVDRKAVEGLTALLASEVGRRPALAVVSGADVRALLGFERQQQLVGCAGKACSPELAGALGVAYLVSSEISRVGSSWLLSLALLDAARAAPVSRLTRRAATVDALVEEVPGAVDELLSSLGAPGAAPPPTRFDGEWEVAIECPASGEGPGVKAYAYRFPASVKDGRLTAQHLEVDAPASLHVEGSIANDGRAQLSARGRSGAAEYSLKRAAPGSAYAYGIAARFEASRGTGQRVEGRPCSFTFTRR